MPLPLPAPLPRFSVQPQAAPTNPVTFGSVRAAALAARQARQLRLKKQQQAILSDNRREQTRRATLTNSRHSIPFHEKKQLKLQLNMEAVAKPEPPPMFVTPYVELSSTLDERSSSEALWQSIRDEPAADKGAFTSTVSSERRPSAFRSRRQSSMTLSINSPEGAEFEEVAHDGPEQLGKLTKRVKRLGKGAGGVVFLSLYLPALKLVAVKEVVVYKEQERELVKHELHALHENLMPIDSIPSSAVPSPGVWTQLRNRLAGGSRLSSNTTACPYLVGFYGAYLLPAKCAISIVMEFMDMGSLQDLLDANVSIPEPILRHCAFCTMTALDHMHRHRMIHRDIKPANILMNSKGEFKIADFGLAGTLMKSESFFSEFEGTMMYMAPERIQGQPYSYVSDLWSMGVSLFYLATGAYPFAVEEGFFGLEEAIVNDPLPPMPNRFSPECREFIKALLQRDPARRMSATQALAHPFLRGYGSSASFRHFPSLWEKMPLSHGTIHSEDVATIAQLLADYVLRQQRRGSRRSSQAQSKPELRCPAPILTDLNHFKKGVASSTSAIIQEDALEKLAKCCSVGVNELQHLLDRAISRQ